MIEILSTTDRDHMDILLEYPFFLKKGNKISIRNNFCKKIILVQKELHLITTDFIFLVNLEESDGTRAVEMYNKKHELVSNNCHAENYLYRVLIGDVSEKITFISPEMEYNRQEVLKEQTEENYF